MNDDGATSAGDFTRSVGDAVRSHPLPAALIGAGLVWLMTGGRSSVKAGFDSAGSGLSSLTSQGSQGASRANGSHRESSGHAGAGRDFGRAWDSESSSFGAMAPRSLSNARDTIADLLERQPLMLGAIGLGVGAAMAAMFRRTAFEADLLGETSASVQERTREMGDSVIGQAADVADRVSAAVTKEARTQGLTPADLTQSAKDIGRKIGNVVSNATNAPDSNGAS